MVDTQSVAVLFEPITVGNLVLGNRLTMTTHGPHLSQRRYLRYPHERSQDVALVGVSASLGVSGFPVGPGSFDPAGTGAFDAVLPTPSPPRGWPTTTARSKRSPKKRTNGQRRPRRSARRRGHLNEQPR